MKKMITIQPEPLSPDEVFITAQRREEIWTRLDRVLPDRSTGFFKSGEIDLTSKEIIKQVKLIISNYISELVARGEIPPGLIVNQIVPNSKMDGHLSVQFGLSSTCQMEHREKLLGFLTGRLSFL